LLCEFEIRQFAGLRGGVGVAEPEEEGLRGIVLRVEVRKVLVLRAYRIFFPSRDRVIARAPAFAAESDVVARLAQQVGDDRRVFRKRTPQARALAELMRGFAGEQT
jgi:hypothetical protein